jgi:1-acyl-sn-glycerol-3-phosphate acyltransferase
VTLRFGEPIHPTGRTDDSSGMRAYTDDIMIEIQKLTGQEYVPRYAPARAKPAPEDG